MDVGTRPAAAKAATKTSILLMDSNSERRALRTRIMALHGVEVIGASDLAEAGSIWHRDRYAMVLMDIRRDYRGCLAWRDEIKKEKPKQVVAFLVGKPQYVDLHPLEDSYTAEEHGTQWGDALRLAVRKSCESLQQRYSFAEAAWRITAARKINGAGTVGEMTSSAQPELAPYTSDERFETSAQPVSAEPTPGASAEDSALLRLIRTQMENE